MVVEIANTTEMLVNSNCVLVLVESVFVRIQVFHLLFS